MKYIFQDNNELSISKTKSGSFRIMLSYSGGGRGQWCSVLFDKKLITDLRKLLKSKKNGTILSKYKLSNHSISISGGSIKALEVCRNLSIFGLELRAEFQSTDLYNLQPAELSEWLVSHDF